MRGLLKHFVIDTVSLYLISQIVSGLVFAQGLTTLIITGAVLSVTTVLIKPVINILLLPLNLITFGLFKWVAYAITLYIVTLLVSGFEISGFNFPGLTTYWFNIPQITFAGTFAFIAFSFLISFFSSIIFGVMK